MNKHSSLSSVIKIAFGPAVFIYIFAAVFFAVAFFLTPNFGSLGNILNLFTRMVPFILVGLAQSLVLLLGEIDLSVGATLSLATVLAATLTSSLGIFPAILILLVTGVAVGVFNGILIGFLELPSLIVTLAVSALVFGISLFIMPQPGGFVAYSLARSLTGEVSGIPVPLIIIFGTLIGATFFIYWSRFGRWIFAAGEDQRVADSIGIPTGRVRLLVFALSGLLASAAGLYLSARMVSGDPLSGESFMLDSIIIAVLGGTSLKGGKGSIVGVLPAALILLMINNFLNLMNVSSYYQFIFRGVILILVLVIQHVDLSRILHLVGHFRSEGGE